MQIIGLMGAMGAGKDTTADIIAQLVPGLARAAFADALRGEIAAAWGVDVRVLLDRTLREVPLEQLALRRCTDPGFCEYAWELASFDGLRPRNLMQRWGDYRRRDNPDHFLAPVEAMRVQARFAGAPVMVVTDVRFANEVSWIRRHDGWLWRITRPGLPIAHGHVSETATRDVIADCELINGGTTDDLRRIIADVLTPLGGHSAAGAAR